MGITKKLAKKITKNSSESKTTEEKIQEVDRLLEEENQMLQRLLLLKQLKSLGFKPGNCDICDARTEMAAGDVVMTKKLPNRVRACVLCYHDRRTT